MAFGLFTGLLMASLALAPTDYVLFQWQPVAGSPSAYNIGGFELQTSSLSFGCATTGDANYYVGNTLPSCWTAKLNGVEFKAGDMKQVVPGFKAQFNPRGFVQVNNGKSDLSDAYIDWFIIPEKSFLKFVSVNTPPIQILGDPGTVRLEYQSDYDIDFPGGFEINRYEGVLATFEFESIDKTIRKGKSIIDIAVKNDKLGTAQLDSRPYILLYDMRLPVTGTSGFCSSMDGVKVCYQQRKIPIGEFASVRYKIVPVGTDIAKSTDVACSVDNQCPQSFVCQKNICTKGIRSESAVIQETFGVGKPNSTAVIAVSIVLIMVIVAMALRKK